MFCFNVLNHHVQINTRRNLLLFPSPNFSGSVCTNRSESLSSSRHRTWFCKHSSAILFPHFFFIPMEETKFSLRLLVDEKKNKVVLAEACRDFVDVLFSLLTLPMGTIVRLLEKHNLHQMRLGCFHNIYKSVSDMTIHDFETEACRTMLLYPKSTKEIHCRRLKLNIDDTEATKFFICPLHFSRESCKKYSNFNTSRCSCGNLMTNQFQVSEEDQIGSPIGNNEDGVFVSCRSSYIITDNLRVTQNSLGVIANELNVLGYADCNDLQEFLLDVGYKEVPFLTT